MYMLASCGDTCNDTQTSAAMKLHKIVKVNDQLLHILPTCSSLLINPYSVIFARDETFVFSEINPENATLTAKFIQT